ncbi:MAG: glutamate synthase subunit beta [Candidatus Omnitrophica bacterium]|nr:glutamate synthase subunit beta [Candidatus Omnitrophota bacterium]
MGDFNKFLRINREKTVYRPIEERTKDYKEVAVARNTASSIEQSNRCMDCGTPFCHWGCAVGNYIPEWNALLAEGKWDKAYELLIANNNLPEVTGRICPALCESACVLGINDEPITCRENELAIVEYAFQNNIVKPKKPQKRTGKKVAVIGSGPAGLSAADQLNKAGHYVTVFEKNMKLGGIMRYGIPDFKLEKSILDRRIKVWEKEGIEFKTGVNVSTDIQTQDILTKYDAVCLAGGSEKPRDLSVEGRDLDGIFFAMDYLSLQNRVVSSEDVSKYKNINAKNKKVVVIGGGDTGSDCVGTAVRQGALSITQIEVLPKPPVDRMISQPWPTHPTLFKTTSSHEEGVQRYWSVLTKAFAGDNGKIEKLKCVKVGFEQATPKDSLIMKEIAGSEFEIQADLVILAVGFLAPEHKGLLTDLNVEYDQRGNVKTDQSNKTTVAKVFAAGDLRRGQSLVVWAISEGRKTAHFIDKYLMGKSDLPII